MILSCPATKIPDKESIRFIIRACDIDEAINAYSPNIMGLIEKIQLQSLKGNHDLFGKFIRGESIEIVFDPTDLPTIYQLNERFNSLRVSFIIKSSEKLYNYINALTSLGYPVILTLDCIEKIPLEELIDLVDMYIFSLSNNVYISPFHEMVLSLNDKEQVDFFKLYDEMPGINFYMDEEGRISSYFIGECGKYLNKDIELFFKNNNAREMIRQSIFKNHYSCSTCRTFTICQGYLRFKTRHDIVSLCRKVILLFDYIKKVILDNRIDYVINDIKSQKATVFCAFKCVNDCVFCAPANMRKEGIKDSDEDIENFIIQHSDIKGISFSGCGEPTMNPRLLSYISLARRCGIKEISLFTNGAFLDENMAVKLKKCGVTTFLLSLHGLEKTHELNVRRPGSFKEVLRAIDILSKLNVDLIVNTCITRINIDDLEDIIEFVKKYEIDTHSLAFPEWSGNALLFQEIMISYTELNERIKQLDFSKLPHIKLDNIPCCVADRRISRVNNVALLLYHDPFIDMVKKSPLNEGENVFSSVCFLSKCPCLEFCCGIDKNYILNRGEEEFIKLRMDLSL